MKLSGITNKIKRAVRPEKVQADIKIVRHTEKEFHYRGEPQGNIRPEVVAETVDNIQKRDNQEVVPRQEVSGRKVKTALTKVLGVPKGLYGKARGKRGVGKDTDVKGIIPAVIPIKPVTPTVTQQENSNNEPTTTQVSIKFEVIPVSDERVLEGTPDIQPIQDEVKKPAEEIEAVGQEREAQEGQRTVVAPATPVTRPSHPTRIPPSQPLNPGTPFILLRPVNSRGAAKSQSLSLRGLKSELKSESPGIKPEQVDFKTKRRDAMVTDAIRDNDVNGLRSLLKEDPHYSLNRPFDRPIRTGENIPRKEKFVVSLLDLVFEHRTANEGIIKPVPENGQIMKPAKERVVELLLTHGLDLGRLVKMGDEHQPLLLRYIADPRGYGISQHLDIGTRGKDEQFGLLLKYGRMEGDLYQKGLRYAIDHNNGRVAEMFIRQKKDIAVDAGTVVAAINKKNLRRDDKIPIWQMLIQHRPTMDKILNDDKARGEFLAKVNKSGNRDAIQMLQKDTRAVGYLNNHHDNSRGYTCTTTARMNTGARGDGDSSNNRPDSRRIIPKPVPTTPRAGGFANKIGGAGTYKAPDKRPLEFQELLIEMQKKRGALGQERH